MRKLHLLIAIILVLCSSCHFHIATASRIKVPSDVSVLDEPGEDECDYSFYLWQVLNSEVSDIDYYRVCLNTYLLCYY
jgi:hypothetical protein